MINPASLHGVSLQRLLDMVSAFTLSKDAEGIDSVRAEIQRRDDNQKAHTQNLTEEVKRQNSALRKANKEVNEHRFRTALKNQGRGL